MKLTMQECLLTKILDCGFADLALLEDIQYDLDDIIDDLIENQDLSLNSIFREVFRQGARDLKEIAENEIEERIKNELEEQKNIFVNTGEMAIEQLKEKEEYKQLMSDLAFIKSGTLDATEDLDFYCNFQDTHVYMRNLDFYQKWIPNEIDDIENSMGWSFRERID